VFLKENGMVVEIDSIFPGRNISIPKLVNSVIDEFIFEYFSITPWSSALIPLCSKLGFFNFNSIEPLISSLVKNVGYLFPVFFL
jgi:hypothetical protein